MQRDVFRAIADPTRREIIDLLAGRSLPVNEVAEQFNISRPAMVIEKEIFDIRLRDAAIGDLKTLRYWDEQLHVVASNPNDDWDWETELSRKPAWKEQLIAELRGRPIGFIQIIGPGRVIY